MGQRIESRDIEERIRLSLENLVFALGEVAGADRSSLLLVDEERSEMPLVSGYRTHNLLCIPVRGPSGRVSAVLELLKPPDHPAFSAEEEREIREHESEISALLEACGSIA